MKALSGDRDELGYLSPEAREVPRGYGEIFKQILEYIHSAISEIKRAPKPFVAAVDGIAAAGGFGIAMACDLVLASERATFEWAYPKTSLTGAESSTFFLPRLIGLRRSMELVLLNPRLDAHAALQMGLITRVYPTERFDDEALALATRLTAGPPAPMPSPRGSSTRRPAWSGSTITSIRNSRAWRASPTGAISPRDWRPSSPGAPRASRRREARRRPRCRRLRHLSRHQLTS